MHHQLQQSAPQEHPDATRRAMSRCPGLQAPHRRLGEAPMRAGEPPQPAAGPRLAWRPRPGCATCRMIDDFKVSLINHQLLGESPLACGRHDQGKVPSRWLTSSGRRPVSAQSSQDGRLWSLPTAFRAETALAVARTPGPGGVRKRSQARFRHRSPRRCTTTGPLEVSP